MYNPLRYIIKTLIKTRGMIKMSEPTQSSNFEPPKSEQFNEISVDPINNPVLTRIIEEVKNKSKSFVHGYDRVHNRHNR